MHSFEQAEGLADVYQNVSGSDHILQHLIDEASHILNMDEDELKDAENK